LPVYDVSAVAEALDFDLKQLDNLLSRNRLPGLEKKRRGLARRLTVDTAVVIRLAIELAHAFDTPPGSLLQFARKLAQGDSSEMALGKFLTLQIDLTGLRASTIGRLDNAVETVGRRRRGRPPSRARTKELGL
jgi:hypothetical protein